MARWWRIGITFRAAANDREDALAKARALFGDLPVPNLKISVDPLSDKQALAQLDEEQAKRVIETDADQGGALLGIMGIPAPRITHPYDQGAWIFPDDHPLAPYERVAKQQKDTQALDAMRALSVKGTLELPPGDSED